MARSMYQVLLIHCKTTIKVHYNKQNSRKPHNVGHRAHLTPHVIPNRETIMRWCELEIQQQPPATSRKATCHYHCDGWYTDHMSVTGRVFCHRQHSKSSLLRCLVCSGCIRFLYIYVLSINEASYNAQHSQPCTFQRPL